MVEEWKVLYSRSRLGFEVVRMHACECGEHVIVMRPPALESLSRTCSPAELMLIAVNTGVQNGNKTSVLRLSSRCC